jgi:hypothetical protein
MSESHLKTGHGLHGGGVLRNEMWLWRAMSMDGEQLAIRLLTPTGS